MSQALGVSLMTACSVCSQGHKEDRKWLLRPSIHVNDFLRALTYFCFYFTFLASSKVLPHILTTSFTHKHVPSFNPFLSCPDEYT